MAMAMAIDLDTTIMDQHGELVVDGAVVEVEVALVEAVARQVREQLQDSVEQDADKQNRSHETSLLKNYRIEISSSFEIDIFENTRGRYTPLEIMSTFLISHTLPRPVNIFIFAEHCSCLTSRYSRPAGRWAVLKFLLCWWFKEIPGEYWEVSGDCL